MDKNCNGVILSFLNGGGYKYAQDLSLSQKTWIKTGGNCAFWIEPDSVEQLTNLCKFLYENSLVFELVGQTSNLFFHSDYHPSIVVSTIKVNKYEIKGNVLTCDCGTSVAKLSREMLAAGYTGFSGLTGLPGTVAGSVYGNASCFKCSINAILLDVAMLMTDGMVHTLRKEELSIAHRSTALKRSELKGIILTVRLQLEKAADQEEEKRNQEYSVEYRKTKQEKPSWCLGSVYSDRKMRRNWRNKVANGIVRISEVLHIGSSRKIMKDVLLTLYGYRQLALYVSDKNVNTFIWRDARAEQMFGVYKEFMGKVHNKLTIEIEEKYPPPKLE